MLLFVYTTTHKRFVIFTCRYFKLSWNTTALSQSNCRNFSCSSTCINNNNYSYISVLCKREVNHHIYIKGQRQICTTWPSFFFTCCLLFIISTPKLLVSSNFSSVRIVLTCFYLLILFFYFEKFSTWIWHLLFAIYMKFKLSIVKKTGRRNKYAKSRLKKLVFNPFSNFNVPLELILTNKRDSPLPWWKLLQVLHSIFKSLQLWWG